MADPVVCTPVDLGGGATLEQPCTGPLGWCVDADYFRARRVLAIERSKELALLNQWTRLANASKVNWNAATTHAWNVDDQAEKMLERYPESGWGLLLEKFKDPTWGFAEMIGELSRMASEVHAAACTLAGELAKIGEAIPEQPIPPAPPKGPTDMVKEAAKNLQDAAQSTADAAASAVTALLYGIGGVVVIGAAWYGFQAVRGGSTTVVVTPGPSSPAALGPSSAPLPPTSSAARSTSSAPGRPPAGPRTGGRRG